MIVCGRQAEMSEDEGHSDDDSGDAEDAEHDGLLARPFFPSKFICHLLICAYLKKAETCFSGMLQT